MEALQQNAKSLDFMFEILRVKLYVVLKIIIYICSCAFLEQYLLILISNIVEIMQVKRK
jgi:hypothetical protein